MKHIRLPLTEADIAALQAGTRCCSAARCIRHGTPPISGCARCLQEGKPLPVELAGGDHLLCGALPGEAR